MATSYEVRGSNLFFSNDENSKNEDIKHNLRTAILTGLSALYLVSDVREHINFNLTDSHLSKHIQAGNLASNNIEHEYIYTNIMQNSIGYLYNNNEEEGFVMSSNFVTDSELNKTEQYFNEKINTVDVKIDNLQNSFDSLNSKLSELATKSDIELLEEKMKNEMHKKTWTAIIAIPTLIAVGQFLISLIS